MKKKILSFLLMMLPAVLLTSCLKDQDDMFSESASHRVANYLDNARKVLLSAENGWVLDYFPHSEQAFGGYSYTLKFDEKNVTACFELADEVTESISSTYILDNEDGPCISFDTYNDYLHFFSTPTGASGPGGYEAYGGDYIFIILNISEDENTITLKGNRSGNIMYMHRLTESISDYQLKLADFTENLVFDKAAAEIDGKKYKLTIAASDRMMTIEPEAPEEGEEAIEAPFCFDKDGFSFYEPVTIGGKEVRVFKYDENEATFTAQEDNSVVFNALLTTSIVINNVGESITTGLGAASLDYTFNLADKFTYSTDVDWITVSVEGKNLKINVAENTTGKERTGNIIVKVGDEIAKITVSQVPLNGLFVSSDAYVAISNVSDAAKPYFLACKSLSDSEGESIGFMVFTNDAGQFGTGYGLFFASGNYGGFIGLDAELVGGGYGIKFTYAPGRNNSNGNWYYGYGYKTLVDYLVSTTFTITADSEDQPTYFILTDKNDPTKYFKLTTSEVTNPFSN